MKYLLLVIISTYLMSEPITPIPTTVVVNSQKVQLGKELFFETKLSADNTISCATCHDLENGGDDGLMFSIGHNAQKGDINAPTVYNSVYNFRQFWDGRSKDLKEQAKGPIQNPIEMANSFENVIKTLNQSPYKQKFKKIYKDAVTEDNIVDAIAEYEKTLITPNAPFDKYLKGDKNAISQAQKEGYELFKDKGCIACHHGINVGGNLYNKFGLMQEANSDRQGRYDVTKNLQDKYFFKVPSLRNIQHTSPYLHDGRYENLEDVVKFMARYQLGRTISDEEVNKMVEFLYSLSGEKPKSVR